MKDWFRAFAVAFSMYSKIPMPRFVWGSKDMQYHLCFFPWVGAVIGALEYGWYTLVTNLKPGGIIMIFVAMGIPLLITGGFHVDGFMDTMDALHSYQDKERKLEILRDPHIGAFSVICMITYLLFVAGFLSEVKQKEAVLVLSLGFVFSRCLSGISVVCFKKAKEDGMLKTSARTASIKKVRLILAVQGVLCSVAMLFVSFIYGLTAIVTMLLVFLYYFGMSKKQFGGITGDLAGFYVVMAEGMSVLTISIVTMF